MGLSNNPLEGNEVLRRKPQSTKCGFTHTYTYEFLLFGSGGY
jgi:hypothetical protein